MFVDKSCSKIWNVIRLSGAITQSCEYVTLLKVFDCSYKGEMASLSNLLAATKINPVVRFSPGRARQFIVNTQAFSVKGPASSLWCDGRYA